MQNRDSGKLQVGTRVRFVGIGLRRCIEKGDEATVIGQEWNERWNAMMFIVGATRHIDEAETVRLWPAELEVI